MGHDDDHSSMAHSRSKHRKEKSSRKHKTKKRRRYDSSDSDQDRKRRKKDRKKDRKRERRSKDTQEDSNHLERNYALGDALLELLQSHPTMATELPVLLIRLASGTSFDLSQMTDSKAAKGLSRVFQALEAFGVQQQEGSWMWKAPPGRSSNQELVLVRVVRAMLDEIGFTDKAVLEYETKMKVEQSNASTIGEKDTMKTLQEELRGILTKFRGDLARELPALCTLILAGESISLDSLPDEALRAALESLFTSCGLEQCEMEDEGEHESSRHEPLFGFALPEGAAAEAKEKLLMIADTCHEMSLAEAPSAATKRPIMGPMLGSESYRDYPKEVAAEESSDEEGPTPYGLESKRASIAPEVIKANAEQRARLLELAKAGIITAETNEVSTREEWMVDPGKYDFLGAIKSGTAKSRKFEAKSKGGELVDKPLDPSVQAEIDDIMQAHEDARGPSLMELHQQKKAEEQAKAAADGQSKSWRWDRDKDLDSGRRVDNEALKMMLGGASKDLKSKFQGGFG